MADEKPTIGSITFGPATKAPILCSQGGIPYNDAHLRAKDAEIAALRRQIAEQGDDGAVPRAVVRALKPVIDLIAAVNDDVPAIMEHDFAVCLSYAEVRSIRANLTATPPAVPDDQRAALLACGQALKRLVLIGYHIAEEHLPGEDDPAFSQHGAEFNYALDEAIAAHELPAVQAALRDAVTPADIAPFLPPLREGDGR